MTNASDPQDTAEALDADKLPGSEDDPTAGAEFPPEQPLGAEEYGTTPGEATVDEPLAERVQREEPEQRPEP